MSKKKEAEKWKKRKEKMKEELKTLTDWKKDLEREVNGIVRILDNGKSCISCTGKVEQAGHYHSVGSNDSLRFNLHNIHGQCIHCNMHKGSNIIGYDEGLIERYGREYWEDVKFNLVRLYPLVKFTVADLRFAISEARKIKKELKSINLILPNEARLKMTDALNKRLKLYT